jgi:hypothetical protein
MSANQHCPTCDRGLWHVGHVCYTYADLTRMRAEAASKRADAGVSR